MFNQYDVKSTLVLQAVMSDVTYRSVAVPRVLDSELVVDNVEFNPQLSVTGSEEFRNLANSLEDEVST